VRQKTLLVTFLFLLSACGGGSSPAKLSGNLPDNVPDEEPVVIPIAGPSISQISFRAADNSGLTSDMMLNKTESDANFTGRLLANTSVRGLVASYEFTGSSVTIDTVVQESGTSVNDFTEVVVYTVANSEGVTESYTVDLTKFTGLPIIYLETDNTAAIDSKDSYVTGNVSIDGGRDFTDFAVAKMKIRGRGNSTWFLHPKKPFQMKFEEKAEFLSMPGDKKWLFLAEHSDKTLLRNKITFEMGYLSNLDWTPQGRFAEVYINDQYNGTYNITQKVEESDNRVVLGDSGYLLELDQLERLDADDVYFDSVITERFLINIKEPSLEVGSAEYTYIKDLFEDFETALYSPSYRSATTGYAKYIDLDSFIDWYLINEITKNQDSQSWSSMFVNVMPSKKIKMGPLWDFDLSFGNVDYSDAQYSDGFWVKFHPWYERLFQDPAFVEKVKIRFAYFKQNQNFILNKIDGYAEQLQWAQQENDDQWQTIGMPVWPNPVVFETYQEEVDHLKSWYSNRMAWLEAALGEL
jgi:spore coat protein CotH